MANWAMRNKNNNYYFSFEKKLKAVAGKIIENLN